MNEYTYVELPYISMDYVLNVFHEQYEREYQWIGIEVRGGKAVLCLYKKEQ